jgi:hypothetical protein
VFIGRTANPTISFCFSAAARRPFPSLHLKKTSKPFSGFASVEG